MQTQEKEKRQMSSVSAFVGLVVLAIGILVVGGGMNIIESLTRLGF